MSSVKRNHTPPSRLPIEIYTKWQIESTVDYRKKSIRSTPIYWGWPSSNKTCEIVPISEPGQNSRNEKHIHTSDYSRCNEKFGCLKYQDKTLSWDFGESSFSRLTVFIGMIYRDGVFTTEQFSNLFDKILEGRQIDCMYDIKDYLIAKREGILWVKTDRARQFRTEMKGFVARVQKHFQDEGFLPFNFPTVH